MSGLFDENPERSAILAATAPTIVVPGVISAVRIPGLLDGLRGPRLTELIMSAVDQESEERS